MKLVHLTFFFLIINGQNLSLRLLGKDTSSFPTYREKLLLPHTNYQDGDADAGRKVNTETIKKLMPGLPKTSYPISKSFDSLNCRFIGNWPFSSCLTSTIDTLRRLFYIGSGGGVYIYSFANPLHPEKLSEKIHTRRIVQGLFSDGNYLYIATAGWGGEFEIWDISNSHLPQKRGSLYFDDCRPRGVVAQFPYVFLGTSNALRVIDISDIARPVQIASLPIGGIYSLVLKDSLGYLGASDSGLRIVNLANPRIPFEVAKFPAPAGGVVVSETLAYIAAGSQFRILNISDPSNPRQLGFLDISNCNAIDLEVKPKFAYIADENSGLRILDISDPSRPSLIGLFSRPFAYEVALFSSYAYLSSNFFGPVLIIDLSNPRSPREVGCVPTPDWAWDVIVANNFAYLVTEEGGLRVICLANLEEPYEVSYYPERLPTKITIFDVAVKDGYAYLSAIPFIILDVRDPARPCSVGALPQIFGSGVAVADTFAYLACGSFGLRIINVSNPRAPQLVSSYELGGRPYTLAVKHPYAYLVCWESGLRIVNVEDPFRPYEVGYLLTPCAVDIAIKDFLLPMSRTGMKA